jgi:hypothetical protein
MTKELRNTITVSRKEEIIDLLIFLTIVLAFGSLDLRQLSGSHGPG